MAPKRINLLQKDVELSQRLKIVKKISFLTLGIYLFLLFIFLGVTFYFFQKESDFSRKNSALKQEVDQFRNKEGLLATLVARAGISRNIYGQSNTGGVELVNELVALFPQGVEIEDIGSTENGAGVVISANSPNSSLVVETITKIKGKQFAAVTLRDLTYKDSGYSFILDVR